MKPLTVRELIALLQQWEADADLPVVLSIGEGDDERFTTFIKDPLATRRNAQQTYLGDQDVLRVYFERDEP